MKSLQIQIKREFWEHRALWIAPLAVALALLAAVAIFGHHPELVHMELDSGETPPVLDIIVFGWGMALYLTAAILVSIYLLDCLYSERRDRSILFWKSLPVSDTKTVLVKLLVGFVIVPLGTFVLAALTSALATAILLLRNPVDLHGGVQLWDTLAWLRLEGLMLYGLIAALLWYAPYATYLMLASAWARRWPSAWAIIPPILLAIFEYMTFGTHYFSRFAQRSASELMGLLFSPNNGDAANFGEVVGSQHGPSGVSRMLSHSVDPSGLLASPQLWLGLAAAALMLALAIRLRRYRDDS
jgi:ABC-2 type transport system permease protein